MDSLTEIGINQAKQTFMPEYLVKMPIDEQKEEGLGIAISHWTEWDGLQIMRVFRAALEDANFNSQAAQVEAWIKAIEAD